MSEASANIWEGVEVIDRYTRAQAIDDGVLIPLDEIAREAGFKYPVAITAAAWAKTIQTTDKLKSLCQDVEGRAWDVVWMLHQAIQRATNKPPTETLLYSLYVLQESGQHKLIRLKSIFGPGDAGEPVLTIMLPDES